MFQIINKRKAIKSLFNVGLTISSITICKHHFSQKIQNDQKISHQNGEVERLLAKKIIEKSKNGQLSPFEDRVYGCILGAFIGDALGSYHEFTNEQEAESLINKVMEMPGKGGTFDTNPGQVTDDSELALALMDGLIKGKGVMDMNIIANEYGNWINSAPFDCGLTIEAAFKNIRKNQRENVEGTNIALLSTSQAYSKNINSQSNGNLMRITPLAIYGHKLNDTDLQKCVYNDVSMTHPSYIANEACFIWVRSLVQILNSEEQNISQKALQIFQNVQQYVNQNIKTSKQLDFIGQWWDEEVENEKLRPAVKQMGWMRIAWTYTYVFLKQIADQQEKYADPSQIYEKIMREILRKGGDTDTNACIVGGMIGALVGLKNLPEKYVEKSVNCSVNAQFVNSEGKIENTTNPRPLCYSPFNGILKIEELLKVAPETLISKNQPFIPTYMKTNP